MTSQKRQQSAAEYRQRTIIATVEGTFTESVCHTLFEQATVNVFHTRELAEKELPEGWAHVSLEVHAEVI